MPPPRDERLPKAKTPPKAGLRKPPPPPPSDFLPPKQEGGGTAGLRKPPPPPPRDFIPPKQEERGTAAGRKAPPPGFVPPKAKGSTSSGGQGTPEESAGGTPRRFERSAQAYQAKGMREDLRAPNAEEGEEPFRPSGMFERNPQTYQGEGIQNKQDIRPEAAPMEVDQGAQKGASPAALWLGTPEPSDHANRGTPKMTGTMWPIRPAVIGQRSARTGMRRTPRTVFKGIRRKQMMPSTRKHWMQ